MSFRLGTTTIPIGASQSSYIQQPSDASTVVANIGATVRSIGGMFYYNISGVSRTIDLNTVFTDTNIWSAVASDVDTSTLVTDSDVTITNGEITAITVGTTSHPVGGGIDLQVFENGSTTPEDVVDGSFLIGGGGIGIGYGRLQYPADSGVFYDNVINLQFDPDEVALNSIAQNRINGLTGQITMLEDADTANSTAISNEVTRAEAVERHLSDLIANQTLGPILRRSGIPAEILAPTGMELIRSIDESDFIRLAYFIHDPQGHSTLSLELIPDSATLANGIWTLMDNSNVVLATLPNNPSFLVGRYDNNDPQTTDTPSFTGHPKFVRWNQATGVFFYDLEIVTGDAYLVSNSGALEDGQMDIDGQTQLGNVFRNWRTLGLVPNVGALEAFADGFNQDYRFREFNGAGNIITTEAVPSTLQTGGVVVNVPRNPGPTTVLDLELPAADFTGLRQQYVEGQIATLYKKVGDDRFSVYLRFDTPTSDPDRLRFTVDSTAGNFDVDGGVDGPWALFPGWEGTGTGGATGAVTSVNAGNGVSVNRNTGDVTVSGGIEMVAYTDILGLDPVTLSTTEQYNVNVNRFFTTGANTQFSVEVNGRIIQDTTGASPVDMVWTIQDGPNNISFNVTDDDIMGWDSLAAIDDVRLVSTLTGSTLPSIRVGDIRNVVPADTDTTLSIQDSDTPETGVTTLNFDNSLNVSAPVNGVATVSVNENEATNVLANAPRTAGELLGLTSYSGTYTLREAADTAPTVNYYGQQANTVPITLPTTVGTHRFTFSWPVVTVEDIQANRGDSATVYGDAPDNLNITVDGDRTFFRDVTSVVGQMLTDIQQMDNGVTRATRTNFDGTSASVDLAGEVVVRSQHNTEWTSTTPPDTLGANGSLAVDDTGSGISALYVKVADTWSSLSFQPTTGVGANLSAGRSGTTVTLRTTTNGDTLVIEGAGAGTLQINDIANQDDLDTAVPLGTMTKALWDGGQFVASVTSTDGTSTPLIHKRLITGNNTTVRNYYGEFTSTSLIVYANQNRSTTLLTQNYTG